MTRYTQTDINVLMWLKVLYEEEVSEKSFDDKVRQFFSEGFDVAEYELKADNKFILNPDDNGKVVVLEYEDIETILYKFVDNNILNIEDGEFVVTKIGKRLFKELTLLEKKSDKTIKDVVNTKDVVQEGGKNVGLFIRNHYGDIIQTLSFIVQGKTDLL